MNSGCIFIDLSKAFDSLNHKRLMHKLKLFGICNKSGPYLNDRYQVTLFNGTVSTKMKVESGVSQGSTLGPLLYILYVNDCFDAISNDSSRTIMYADDTALLTTVMTFEELKRTLQIQMNKYYEWCLLKSLRINVNKTKMMILCSKYNVEVECDGKEIKLVDNYVYLGVDLDRHLTFEPFIKNTIQKVNYKLYLFCKIRYLLTSTAAVLVYKQMVLPFFDYLDIILDSCSKYYIEKLQKLQFRGIKIIYQYSWNGKPLTSADEDVLHDELGIVLLKYRRIRHLLIIMFDLKSRRYDLLDSFDYGISLRS